MAAVCCSDGAEALSSAAWRAHACMQLPGSGVAGAQRLAPAEPALQWLSASCRWNLLEPPKQAAREVHSLAVRPTDVYIMSVLLPIAGQRPSIAGVAPGRLACRQQSHRAASCSGLHLSGWMDGSSRSQAGLSFHSSVSRSLRAAGRSTGRVQPTQMMFERFTEKAIKVVMLAQEEARRLGHNFVGTEQASVAQGSRSCLPAGLPELPGGRSWSLV